MADTTAGGGSHRGEGKIFGASGILGVNSLQKAIDSFDHTVEKMQRIVDTMGKAEAGFRAGQGASGSWNRLSNWSGGSNGGNATFNGQPAGGAGNGAGGGGGGGGSQPGSHRADGPAQVGFGGNTGGAHAGSSRLPIGPIAGAVGLTSGIYQNLTQSKSSADEDSMAMNTVAGYWSWNSGPGQGRKMFDHMDWAANGVDAAAGMAEINDKAGGLPGSSGWNSLSHAAQQISYGNPYLGAAASAKVAVPFYGRTGYSNLRTVGVTTIGKGGRRLSPTMIANQVLNQIDPQGTIVSKEDAAALVGDEQSNLNALLGNWVANGVIGGDQVEAIRASVLEILKARRAGIDVNSLDKMLNNRNLSKKDKNRLARAGIANTGKQLDNDAAAAKRQSTVDRLPDFADGLKQATDNLEGFSNWLRDLTSNPNKWFGRHVGRGIAQYQGETHHGGFWGFLTEMNGLVNPPGPLGGSPFGVSSPATFPFGGSNESRMSVLALQGSVGASAGGGGLAGVSPSSEPYSVAAATMGGISAGGGGRTGGGGSSAKAGKSGQRMILPARGTLGVGYGVKGPMWHATGYHTGQDIRCPTGTSIHAPANGTVIFAGWDGPYGNLIKIAHGGGIVSYMAHNSRLVAHVGAHVRQGQLIAYSGRTGNTSGPHCHFEVRVNGHSVNPMQFVTGAGRVSGGGGGGGGGTSGEGTSGSGTNAPNGSGTGYTDDSTSGASGASGFVAAGSSGSMSGGGTLGLSESDILLGAMSGSGTGIMNAAYSDPGSDGSSPGGSPSGSPGSGPNGDSNQNFPGTNFPMPHWLANLGGKGGKGAGHTVGPGKGDGVTRWRGTVIDAMHRLGIKASAEHVNRTLMQMRTESSGNPTIVNKWDSNWHAGHPSVGLMQVIRGTFNTYAGPFRHTGPFSYGVSTNPEANIYAALNYAVHRYGSIDNAFHGHGYAKGAWDIAKDEIAQVHKNEMIIPAKEADQIRQILVNGNPYKAMGNQAKASGHQITFGPNSISIRVTSTGNPTSDGNAIGKAFLDTLQQNVRLDNLQAGVSG